MIKICLLFPGQGSQYVKMGENIYNEYSIVKEVFQEAGDILKRDVNKMFFEISTEKMNETNNAQLAIFILSMAYYKIYMKEIGITPIISAGHSLGEYSALCASNVFSFETGLKLIKKRSEFMFDISKKNEGTMSAVLGLESGIIENVCREITKKNEIVVIANFNSPNQTVISGNSKAVEKVHEKLKDYDANIIPLKVQGAFHSPLMIDVTKLLKTELENYSYSDFSFPVISNVTGEPYALKENILNLLTYQVICPVQWQITMEYINRLNIDVIVELGPKAVLKKLFSEFNNNIKSYSYDYDDIFEISNFIKTKQDVKIKENLKKGISVITKCLAVAVSTKNNNWNNDEYQNGVSIPYKKILGIQDIIVNEQRMPDFDEMNKALDLLKIILKTKKVSKEEQKDYFEQIFIETGTKSIFKNYDIS